MASAGPKVKGRLRHRSGSRQGRFAMIRQSVGSRAGFLTLRISTMRRYRIAVIPGDGIGKEVIPAGLEVLKAVAEREGGVEWSFDQFDWGSDFYRETGLMMPPDGREHIKDHDAIYFGAVGAPDVPDHVSLWGLRLAICQPFDQYANVRPARVLPGIVSPLRHVSGPELDWMIVRENSEGEYAGVGGRVHRGLPLEVATDVSIMTRAGVERIFRFAFALARSRPRKLLTIVTKSNAQRHAMVMWDEIGAEIAREYADVTSDKMLVDAMTMRMTIKPESLERIAASNLPPDFRADSRLGVRHRRQGNRQSDRLVLDRRNDARTPRRKGGCESPHAG